MTCAMLALSTVVMIAALAPVDQAPSPVTTLPDAAPFIAEVRKRIRTDEELQSQYTYLEKRQEIRMSKLGKVQLGDERLFEVYPSSDPGETFRRLIAVNGARLPADELQRRDQRRRKRLEDRELIWTRETPPERARREAKQAQEERKRQEIVEDVFRAYDIALVGREVIDGHPAVIATLTPRPNAATRSDIGKYIKKLRGRAWVSEDDFQVIKVDVEATSDLLIGWGMVGRLHQGSRMIFERRKVNDEVWLPSRARVVLSGRALLLRKFRVEAVTEFSDYRKFGVETKETYGTPVP